METITGSVERVTYYNPENGYSVLRLKLDQSSPAREPVPVVTVTGSLPEISPGEHLRLQGDWTTHPVHGRQFQVQVCERLVPASVEGIRRYLGSGLIRGIGPRLADRLVDCFGASTLDVIETQPELLVRAPDIGKKRAALIVDAWQEQKQVKEIMLFLHSHGISTNLAIKIHKHYGDQALSIVRTDPYRLAQDIFGVGFKTADRIARALGLPNNHPTRIEAGLIYVLNQAEGEGHVYLPLSELESKAVALLDVPQQTISPALARLVAGSRIVQESFPNLALVPNDETLTPAGGKREPLAETGVYLSFLYYAETGCAERLKLLASAFPTRLSDLPPQFVKLDPLLSAEQREAIRRSLGSPLSILTGGPGTGKTTALKALMDALEGAGKRCLLASPTGRAAKRLSQATGRPASTIHRLLGYAPGEGFKFGLERPLPADFLVIDEASMLDLNLAFQLLQAVEPGAHLLLVGDVDQLPSVGAGDFLHDLIHSGIAPLTRLSVIFRQAANSQIITDAHRINQGEMPHFSTQGADAGGDFFLFPVQSPEEAADWVEDVVCRRIPQKFGLHSRTDIQVLSPMYRGPAGVDALNARLQSRLNPAQDGKSDKSFAGQVLRPGDKLMQVVNNYDKEVYNGDIGSLYKIDFVEQSLVVDFDGRAVAYDWSEADQLVLAYAISVHKSQGAEFPAVVIPLLSQHYMMLQRNLLYTAVTRAKRLCVLVASRKAIAIAVRNNPVARRNSALEYRLQSAR